MTSKPDETTDDEPTVEAGDVAVPKDITEIQSLEDVKNVLSDGFEKLKDSSAADIKKTAFRAGNRLYKAWRKLVDGD